MNIKQAVLQTLEHNKGQPVSGGTLAEALNVSRTAIWKAINSLREEGYPIGARTRQGYILDLYSDFLSAEGILPYLDRSVPLVIHKEVDSTNTVASGLALQGCPENTTVIADHQTKGRGRRGRSFYSPAGTGLYMSLVLRPDFDASQSVLITTAASVAVAKAIRSVCHQQVQIKWVNDLYLNGKKVCGILTEALTDFETGQISHLILGIGINCFTENFSEEAGPLAGSIQGTFSKNQLAAEVINQILKGIETMEKREFISYYREHSMILGQKIHIHPAGTDRVFRATARDIDASGGLLVAYEDGAEEVLRSGEITIRVDKAKETS